MPEDDEDDDATLMSRRPFLLRLIGFFFEAVMPFNLGGAVLFGALAGIMFTLNEWLPIRWSAVVACSMIGLCDLAIRGRHAFFSGWPAVFHPRRGGHLFFAPVWIIVALIAMMWLIDP